MKLKYPINLHKGITFLVVLALMFTIRIFLLAAGYTSPFTGAMVFCGC
jgi:hypothetical protein